MKEIIFLYGQRLYLHKGFVQSISKIFGIGVSRGNYIAKFLGFGAKSKLFSIGEKRFSKNIEKLAYFIGKYYIVDMQLKRVRFLTRKRLSELEHRKALRFIENLPVNGQRTKSNAKTAKINKKNA